MRISMIAAMTRSRVIGADNDMPWHLPADLKHFKSITLGKPVIMGRKTYESIGRALPGRKNIVVTGQSDYHLDDATVVDSTEAAIAEAAKETDEEVMIIGGGRIYQTFLADAQRLYLTFIDADIEGDTYFPDYAEIATWREVSRDHRPSDDKNAYSLSFVTLDRG